MDKEKQSITFIGGFFDAELEKQINSNSLQSVQYAANEFQWKLIEGFKSLSDIDLSLVSVPYVSHYPKGYKKIYFNSDYKGNDYTVINFVNLFGVKNFSRTYNLKKYIKKQNFFENQDIIFLYGAHTPFLKACKYLKKNNPDIKIYIVLPDLPQYMNIGNKNIIFNYLKKIDSGVIYNLFEFVDFFVLLTDAMSNQLDLSEKQKYIVVEGISSQRKNEYTEVETKNFLLKYEIDTSKINICYTGSINEQYGILDLIEAFSLIEDSNYRLYICGRGDSQKEVIKSIDKDDRIIYLGQLTIRDSKMLQKVSSILVNPRKNIAEFTKYSFPSKNIEYLESGNPVIAYKLDGIPKCYDSHIFFVKDNDIYSLRNEILRISKLDKNVIKSRKKRTLNFLDKEKSPKVTVKKILTLDQEVHK